MRPPEMDIAEIAKKVDALEAELAAKCARIADLEARVSLLETENARLRKAVVSGGEEEGMAAVDVHKAGSSEEGVPAVPTPVDFAVRVATGQSDDEVQIMDEEGGGGGDHGSVLCGTNVCLEDDDVSGTPRGKKRAATQVISDSDSGEEDENDEGHGNQEVGAARKRAFRGVSDSESESEEEDESEDNDDGELHEMEGCSTPATRRAAQLGKSQSKRIRPAPARRALDFVEPKDHEESEDDSEEDDDSMDGFIDDDDCTESSADSAEESSADLEESYNEETYEETMDRIRGKKNASNKDWETEAEMLAAFGKNPELCLKAVCALYRKQTEEEKEQRSTIVHNNKGFSQIHAPRGSLIAQFLLDGDACGPLKKTAEDLKKYERSGVESCVNMAFHYSKQLFEIYLNKDDPYFP